MRKLALVLLATALTSTAAFAAVSKAKIAELSAHRIDRLVALNKIDRNFLTRLEKIEVTAVNQPPVAFKSRISQVQPPSGQPLQLDLSFDQDGKALAFQPVAGGVAGPDPQWPGIDPGSLTENALHNVLENATDAKMKTFYEGLTSFTLSKGDIRGTTVARAQIQSSLTTERLNVYLSPDGTFISAEVVP